MFGAPPNCRPECVIHQDCPSNRACIAQRCEDPCVGACGFNAVCTSQNHRPICSCIEGHEGDPYAGCSMRASKYKFTCLLSFSMIFDLLKYLLSWQRKATFKCFNVKLYYFLTVYIFFKCKLVIGLFVFKTKLVKIIFMHVTCIVIKLFFIIYVAYILYMKCICIFVYKFIYLACKMVSYICYIFTISMVIFII